MKTNEFLKVHTVPSGDFSNDPEIVGIVSVLAGEGWDLGCHSFIKNDRLLSKCLTAQLLVDFLAGRPIYQVGQKGELIFKTITPTIEQLVKLKNAVQK